ncbi:hypothetical protein NHF45_11725 [Maricaulaceae bacterium NA33B04]|nr:hypothetical protein [Maricaulaceae bacterium NA33B04]
MTVDIWIRARSGPSLGIGHRVRAEILAQALVNEGVKPGLILDSDTSGLQLVGVDLAVWRLPEGAVPPDEANTYPDDGVPVILDLSHPSMLDDLPELVRSLNGQGRRVGLIDGLGAEGYIPEAAECRAHVALTPYILEPDAPQRTARTWLRGAQYAVLNPIYRAEPALKPRDRDARLLVSISGTDPWSLTEACVGALVEGGLPDDWKASVVAGPGFDGPRCVSLEAMLGGDDRFDLVRAPSDLRSLLISARLGLLGPGLAKFEAAACSTYSLIASPSPDYADMNRPFEAAGLATVLPAGPPDATTLRQVIQSAGPVADRDTRKLVDGGGAERAAKRFVSELITESRDIQ